MSLRQDTIRGYSLQQPGSYGTFNDNVANAFYTRKWLVELRFAQSRFILAVNNCEARTPYEAERVAISRASKTSKEDSLYLRSLKLGDVMSSRVLHDCEESRETLGIVGQKTRVLHMNMRAS